MLLNRGANTNAQGSSNKTPLHQAAEANSLKVATLLLDRGAHIETKDWCGRTPLYTAAQHNNLEVATLLLNSGANINFKANGYSSFYSIVTNQIDLIRNKGEKLSTQTLLLFLNDIRLNTSLETASGDTALSIAQKAAIAIQEKITQLLNTPILGIFLDDLLEDQKAKAQEIIHLINLIKQREERLPRKLMMLILHSIREYKPKMLEKLLLAQPQIAYDLQDNYNNDLLDTALEGVPVWQDVAFKMGLEATAEHYEQIHTKQNELILKRIAKRHNITYTPENLEQLYTIAAQEREELVKIIIKCLHHLLATYRPDTHNMDTRKYQGEFGKVLAKVLPIAQLEAEQEQQANGSTCA